VLSPARESVVNPKVVREWGAMMICIKINRILRRETNVKLGSGGSTYAVVRF
jgi:hypothetical protein